MSSPPDFLGLALGLIRQQQARSAQMQSSAMDAAQRQQELQQHSEAMRENAFRASLALVRSGLPVKAVMGRYGDQLRAGDLPLLQEEEKLAKQPRPPSEGEQATAARGVGSILQSGAANKQDPLRTAVSALGSYPDYGPTENTRIAMLGGSVASDRAARASAYEKTYKTQSDITEERAKRIAAYKANLKSAKADSDKNSVTPVPVEAAWQTFQDSSENWDDWSQDPATPRSVVANAMKHPAYLRMLQARASFNRPATAVPMLPKGQPPPALAQPAPPAGQAPVAPQQAGVAGDWIDLGNGVRIRRKQ